MNTLLEQIKMQDAAAFTHGGKFHLILEGANTIITSATAVSVKMVFLMPHSVFYGKNLGQKFSVKNLP